MSIYASQTNDVLMVISKC